MEKYKSWLNGSEKTNRYIELIYQESGIEKRHSVIADLQDFYCGCEPTPSKGPTTKSRNDLFTAATKEMSVSLARKAILDCHDIHFSDITHLIVVSCTGFFNPGPDYEIIHKLDLNKNVQRYNLGFMGCYGAFPGLRLAHAICQSDPDATVLMVAVELCTLHAQYRDDLDSILGSALFGDGGAAVIINSRPPKSEHPVFRLEHFESTLIPDSEGDMAWTIGDAGFEMVLSQYIPKIIQANITEIITPMLARRGMTVPDIRHWAIHPGGRLILDKIEFALRLNGRLEPSRTVLREYGNMSSPTVLFVLKEILRQPSNGCNEPVLSMAFGPGLTVEVGFLNKQTVLPTTQPMKTASDEKASSERNFSPRTCAGGKPCPQVTGLNIQSDVRPQPTPRES
jgi:predicted naringenin-chalcone synthase